MALRIVATVVKDAADIVVVVVAVVFVVIFFLKIEFVLFFYLFLIHIDKQIALHCCCYFCSCILHCITQCVFVYSSGELSALAGPCPWGPDGDQFTRP